MLGFIVILGFIDIQFAEKERFWITTKSTRAQIEITMPPIDSHIFLQRRCIVIKLYNNMAIQGNDVWSNMELEQEIPIVKGNRRVSFSTSLVSSVVEVPRHSPSAVGELFYSSNDIQNFRINFRLQLTAYYKHKLNSLPSAQRAKYKQALAGQRKPKPKSDVAALAA